MMQKDPDMKGKGTPKHIDQPLPRGAGGRAKGEEMTVGERGENRKRSEI